MGKVIKSVSIICGIMIAIGFGLAVTGYLLGGMKPVAISFEGVQVVGQYDSNDLETVEEQYVSVSSINLDLHQAQKIIFKEGDAFSVNGVIPKNQGGLTAEWQNGVLTLRNTQNTKRWFGIFDFGRNRENKYSRVEVTYPAGTTFDVVNLRNGAGNLQVSDISAKELIIRSDLGNLDLVRLAADSMDITAAAGNASAAFLTTGSITVHLSTGNLDLSDLIAEDADISNNLGNIDLSRLTAETLKVTSDMGRCGFADLEISSGSFKASNGQMEFQNLKSGRISITANMGDVNIKGWIAEDASDITNDLGKVSVRMAMPEREVGYRINVDMGSINVAGSHFGSHASADRPTAKAMINIEANMGDVDLNFSPE